MTAKDTSVVDRLAQIIRTADGNHDMSAGALADAIADSGFLFELEEAAREEGYNQGWESALDANAWSESYPREED